ncbi:MAG: hypothetical protein IRZ08_15500 [Frankia sp.]|nr:hypothetical protein [Frankia sp.]
MGLMNRLRKGAVYGGLIIGATVGDANPAKISDPVEQYSSYPKIMLEERRHEQRRLLDTATRAKGAGSISRCLGDARKQIKKNR